MKSYKFINVIAQTTKGANIRELKNEIKENLVQDRIIGWIQAE